MDQLPPYGSADGSNATPSAEFGQFVPITLPLDGPFDWNTVKMSYNDANFVPIVAANANHQLRTQNQKQQPKWRHTFRTVQPPPPKRYKAKQPKKPGPSRRTRKKILKKQIQTVNMLGLVRRASDPVEPSPRSPDDVNAGGDTAEPVRLIPSEEVGGTVEQDGVDHGTELPTDNLEDVSIEQLEKMYKNLHSELAILREFDQIQKVANDESPTTQSPTIEPGEIVSEDDDELLLSLRLEALKSKKRKPDERPTSADPEVDTSNLLNRPSIIFEDDDMVIEDPGSAANSPPPIVLSEAAEPIEVITVRDDQSAEVVPQLVPCDVRVIDDMNDEEEMELREQLLRSMILNKKRARSVAQSLEKRKAVNNQQVQVADNASSPSSSSAAIAKSTNALKNSAADLRKTLNSTPEPTSKAPPYKVRFVCDKFNDCLMVCIVCRSNL